MTVQEFVDRLPYVKPKSRGWQARCPAHADKGPSLSVSEGVDGRVLLTCFAGCTAQSICEAMGLRLTDLFATERAPDHRPVTIQIPTDWRDRAMQWELHALDCDLQADKIFTQALRCGDCETWTELDWDDAVQAVSRGYQLRERAHWCREYADELRGRYVRH